MLAVPGGSYKIGTDNQIIPADREGPAKPVELSAFYLDVHEVSNAEFGLFVDETQYRTEAEIFGNSFVADYYVSEEVKATISQAVAAAPWWLPVEVPTPEQSTTHEYWIGLIQAMLNTTFKGRQLEKS